MMKLNCNQLKIAFYNFKKSYVSLMVTTNKIPIKAIQKKRERIKTNHYKQKSVN